MSFCVTFDKQDNIHYRLTPSKLEKLFLSKSKENFGRCEIGVIGSKIKINF
jgi:hypothetical protein